MASRCSFLCLTAALVVAVPHPGTGAQGTTPAASRTSATSPMPTTMNPWWTGAPGTQCSMIPQFVTARTGVTGLIQSPNYPNDYPNNARCRWKIAANPGYVVHLYVLDLDLEAHSSCSDDSISIYDGGYRSRLLAKLCGNSSQYMSFYSTGRFMLLDFRSDSSVVERGFQLRYRAVLPSQANYNTTTTARPTTSTTSTTSPTTTTMNPWRTGAPGTQFVSARTDVTGLIQSPNYPNDYPTNARCSWKIAANPGYVVHLYVVDLDLEAQSSCSYDSISIFDGGPRSRLLAKFCGHSSQYTSFYSTGRFMFLDFRSDDSVVERGFQLRYRAVLPSQSNYITTTTRTTPTSSATSRMTTMENPWWTGAPGTQCSMIPQCVSARTGVTGMIQSPNYPNDYPNNARCSWKIAANPGYVVHLYVVDLDLEAHSSCSYDSISIYDGGYRWRHTPLLAKLCGNSSQYMSFYSTGRFMLLDFRSDSSVVERGFQLMYRAVLPSQANYITTTTTTPTSSATSPMTTMENPWWTGAPGTRCSIVPQFVSARTDVTGLIQSPNYPNDYPNNSNCGWKIEASQGYVVRLYVARIDMEETDDCRFDSITVFDGDSPVSSPRLATLCDHTDQGRQFYSNGRYMYVKFTSDQSIVRSGFQLDYEAVQSSDVDPHAMTFMPWWDRTTTTTTADRYRSLYTHSRAAFIGSLTVGSVGVLAFLFAVVIVCRHRNKHARTPPPPSSPAQDPSVLYHNNAVFMVPSVACMSPSLGYTKKGYTNMGYTSYVTLQTGPPNTLAAQPSEKTGPPNTLAAQPSGQTGPPSTLAAHPSGQTGPPNTLAAQPSGQTGPPSTLAAQPSGQTGPPNTLAAQPSGENGPPQTGPSETMA